ncbi:helix-turn-helix domain-containing protein [Vibrio sp. PP-XX7]
MKEARRRLIGGNVQVMTVATDLGYANASHFTAAFQKQFGVNPSTFKHCFVRDRF